MYIPCSCFIKKLLVIYHDSSVLSMSVMGVQKKFG